MFKTFRVNLPAVSTPLSELVGNEVTRCNSVLLQAPMANTDLIYFGEAGREYAFILNGGSAGIDTTNLRDICVYGDPADAVIVIIS